MRLKFQHQCSTHYSPAGNGDEFVIAVHKNVRMSEVFVSDVLDSDHLLILFHLLDHLRARDRLDPVDKFTDWERFQSLASELISPRIKITSGKKPIKRPAILLHL
jgi:hypothetical protein